MRDPKKLKVFEAADDLVLVVYRATVGFPDSERYGLTSQIRRSVVSVSSNLVEGCSRESAPDFKRFVEIAFGSATELQYQLSLAFRLGFFSDSKERDRLADAEEQAASLCRQMNGFLQALRSENQ